MTRCEEHCGEKLSLDNAFALIEGHQPLTLLSPRGEVQQWYSSRVSVARHEQGEEKGPVVSYLLKDKDLQRVRRRIRVLWFGLGLYFLIMLNAFRYLNRVPYQILILGSLMNAGIIVAIIMAMRNAYKRLRQ